MIASVMSSDITIFNESVLENTTVDITFWQLFFVLLTIIPVSKMLSMIFMNILARLGTVDEHRWATIGMGSLAGLFTLGKVTAGAARGINPNSPATKWPLTSALNTDTTLNATPGFKNPSRQSAANTIESSTVSAGDVKPNIDSSGDIINSAPDRLKTTGISNRLDTPTNVLNTEEPGIYPPSYPDFTGTESNSIKNEETQDNDIRAAQQQSFVQKMKNADERANKSAASGVRLGKASGAVIPGAGDALGAFFGAGVKTITAPISAIQTTYQLGKSIQQQGNLNLKQTMTEMTGRETLAGGIAQAGTAVVFSPLGSNVSRTSLKIGGGIDAISHSKAIGTIGNIKNSAPLNHIRQTYSSKGLSEFGREKF